ncbi:hypothetical protein CRYUN_Cryun09bG0201700 [Craigia yunnanensis]
MSIQEMPMKASKKHVKEILELFKQGTSELVLTGNARTGKTWMARAVSECAVREGHCYETLWISLDQNYEEKSLYETIARQLSLLTSEEEWEDGADNEKKEESVEDLKLKIQEDIRNKKIQLYIRNYKEKLDKETEEKFLLLVLDCEGEKMTGDDIRNKLGLDAFLKKSGESIKVLITTKKSEGGPITRASKKVEPLCGEEASSLLKESVKKEFSTCQGVEELSEAIKKRSNVLPDEIIMLAGALNYFAEDKSRVSELGHTLELALDAAANVQTPLLQYAYDMLPNDCMINCFWHCWHFLSKHSGVNYNELIIHWIMEGYLDHANRMEKAYEMGHHILMELIDRGMLRMQEDNMIAAEAAILNVNDHHCRGFSRLANLGLASILEDEERKVFERITPGDNMIKTLGGDKKEETVSSLLIDGSHLSREAPKTFFQAKQNLKVLAVFNPRLKTFPFSDSKMEKLLVLVLRGSYLLEDCSHIAKLKALTVLEISGATYLEEIPDGLFNEVPQLRSLNLSALGIKLLPSSISKLTELCRLILRQCSCVEELPKLEKLEKLEVLDLSKCTSLTKIQDKCFKTQLKLQVLDFSETKIEKFPIVMFLKDLTRLSLKGCKCLTLLRNLKGLSSIKIVDLSGAVKIEEIRDDCFENTDNLRVLDLSYTKIQSLPSCIVKLCDLKLKGCSSLKNLPSTTALVNLESLDLSEASSLINIQDESFEHLQYLYYLNLSNTKVASLPSLCNLGNLRKLLLKDCSLLESLPAMTGLIRLEVFDLSGCKAMSEIRDEAFNDMSRLQELNLSETQIKHLPSFCNPRNLHSLVLRDCNKLETLPDLKSLSKLEVLDLSGTNSLNEIKAESLNHMTQLRTLELSKLAFEEFSSISSLINLHKLSLNDCSGMQPQPGGAVKSLPSLENLRNLRELSLRGFTSLTELPSLKSLIHLGVLDLSKTRVGKLPDEISELTHLKCLHLPDLKLIQGVRWKDIKRLELHWDGCCISESSEILSDVKKPSLVVHSAEFFRKWKEDPKLRETTSKLFKRLIFSIHSSKLQCLDKDDSRQMGELICSDVYFKIRNFPPDGKDGQCLEIRDAFPVNVSTDIQDAIMQTEYISLVENEILRCLSDLKPENLKKIKGCWIERCTKMKSIFDEMVTEIGERLEILWISTLPNLMGLYNGKEQPLNFRKLKHLCLDCCPMLEAVFYSSQLLESLEILQIKFCDRLKTLVGHEELENSEGQSLSLINLKELHIYSCPMIETVFPSVPENLETLQIKCCDKLQSLFRQEELANSELSNLNTLHLLALPELTSVGFKLQNSFLKNVKGCPKLQVVEGFESGIASSEITRNG